MGTLQRLPKVVGGDSLMRELVYTARKFSADEALQIGMVRSVNQCFTETTYDVCMCACVQFAV